eukprot:3218116-Alexandrium_andersonii.AAC.1
MGRWRTCAGFAPVCVGRALALCWACARICVGLCLGRRWACAALVAEVRWGCGGLAFGWSCGGHVHGI